MPTQHEPAQLQTQITDVVLATAGYDHTIKFWEALSGAGLRTIQNPDPINRLAVSPDKRLLAAAGSPVNDVIIHPNMGELISCDQNGSIRIWDLGENGIGGLM